MIKLENMRLLALLLLAAAAPAQTGFYPFAIDQDALSGAPDFGFLNHSLTAADRIFVRGGHFYRAGEDLRPDTADDERVRFFGVNLAFGANFPEEDDAPRIARRLRRLGVNLVRLHHMDSRPDARPETASSLLTTGPYPTLNLVAVARLRRFLDALKAEGIWINLNLKVGYVFRPDADGVPALPDGAGMPRQSKPLHIILPRMIALQAEFTRAVVDALALRDDPVLAMVEINNESSLAWSWQANQMDAAVRGDYEVELRGQWNRWLAARYADTAALRAAWGGQESAGSLLPAGETIEDGTVSLVSSNEPAGEARINDYLRFLAERDRHYLDTIRDALRERAGARVPVAGTQMGFGGLLNLQSHAGLDYQDNHFYVDHYNFPHVPWDGRDWRIRNQSSIGSGLTAFLNVAAAREAGRPYTVSEFNQPWPNTHAAEIDPTLAAFAAFQDWDGLAHFAYSHARNWDDGVPNGFNLNGDWTKFPNFGQAAWLFRMGAVKPAAKYVEIPVSQALAVRATREKRRGAVSTFLNAAAGYDPLLAMVHRVAIARDDSSPMPGALGARLTAPYRSDTGELLYDSEGKRFIIRSPMAAGVFGSGPASAGALEIETAAPVNVLVTPLDGRPLAESRRLLISHATYCLRSQPGADPPRPQRLVDYPGAAGWRTIEPEPDYAKKPSGNINNGARPVWMAREEIAIVLRIAAPNITVFPLDGAGRRMAPLAAERVPGGFRLRLHGEGQALAPWYEVVAREAVPAPRGMLGTPRNGAS